MTAELQIALWGAATVAPLALNIATKRDTDALSLSCMIVLIWTLGRVFGALYSPPESMTFYPVIDAAAGLTALSAWLTQKAGWKLALACLYVGQSIAHVAFWAAWPSEGSLLRYLWVNNGLYALQLLCVAYPGGRHVVALMALSWVSGGARHRPHAGA
jgi:hypothetical protein